MYSNFTGLYKVRPKRFLAPKSLNELIADIRESNVDKSKPDNVRVIGSNHVFNDISLSSDVIIDMKHLDKPIKINKSDKTAVIQGGITLDETLRALDEHGLTIPVFVATDDISMAGGTCTGAHGSCITYGSLSNTVIGADIVLADGTLKRISKADKDLLRAIRCSLGCLGAIYSLTLKCIDQFSIIESSFDTTWPKLYKDLDETLAKSHYAEMDVDPHSHIDALNTHVTLFRSVAYDPAYGPAYDKLTTKVTSLYIEIELAFPYEEADNAVKAVCNFHQKYKVDHNVYTSSPLLIRFSDADDTLISMASGRKTVYVSTFFGSKGPYEPPIVYKFMHKLSDEMVRDFKARPHYGKQHGLTQKQMVELYGVHGYTKFREIKETLDPKGIFSNNYIKRLFN